MDGDVLSSVQPTQRPWALPTPSVSWGLNGEGQRPVRTGLISSNRKMAAGNNKVGWCSRERPRLESGDLVSLWGFDKEHDLSESWFLLLSVMVIPYRAYEFSRAAVTGYHRRGSWHNGVLFSHSSGGEGPHSRVGFSWGLCPQLADGRLIIPDVSSCGLSSVCTLASPWVFLVPLLIRTAVGLD